MGARIKRRDKFDSNKIYECKRWADGRCKEFNEKIRAIVEQH